MNEETFAAIDLGSNSFHMIVARHEHGELRIIDRLKEMVRIAGGLDADGNLDTETREAALSCLAKFGQRIRGIPNDNIRAVGTQSFRRMRQSRAVLMLAETALGCPIEIVAGREEARLVYIGVSQDIANAAERNLVLDIGGGSTELVIGEGIQPRLTESLQYGCVGLTRDYFPGGELTEANWNRARAAVMADLQELARDFRQTGWHKAVGSSGTCRAVFAVCQAKGWIDRAVTPAALVKLRRCLQDIGHTRAIDLDGVSSRRAPVFAGGVAILDACFQALGIEEMVISNYALREGVLYDLLGRLSKDDPRELTVAAFAQRYNVNPEQAEQVWRVAQSALAVLIPDFELQPVHKKMLHWACQLHEVGLSISHSSYQNHSGYLVENSDMAGFSQQEQRFLAALVRLHRRKIPSDYLDGLPPRLHQPLKLLLVCLRLGVVLARSRDPSSLPELKLQMDDEQLNLILNHEWQTSHPLTVDDLQQNLRRLETLKLPFSLSLNQN